MEHGGPSCTLIQKLLETIHVMQGTKDVQRRTVRETHLHSNAFSTKYDHRPTTDSLSDIWEGRTKRRQEWWSGQGEWAGALPAHSRVCLRRARYSAAGGVWDATSPTQLPSGSRNMARVTVPGMLMTGLTTLPPSSTA